MVETLNIDFMVKVCEGVVRGVVGLDGPREAEDL
jgi:hypothetical protein